MPIITEPKKLSMPQQVQKNKEDIESIFKKIDGLDATDNVVVVPDIDHVMTPEELESVQEPVAFILFENKVFIKRKIENNVAYFDIVFSIVLSNVITLRSEELEVDMFTGHLVHRVISDSTYSVSQIDNKFATITYVDSALASKASLSGANFTGAITAPSIIENMSGFSFITPAPQTGIILNLNYAGVVKTGNKITFAVSGTITTTDAILYYTRLIVGNFDIPASIGQKLFPYAQGSLTNVLSQTLVLMSEASSVVADVKKASGFVFKNSNTNLQFTLYPTESDLVAGKVYNFRIEQTYLLSDNLAQ